jgi:hypothetical protein
VLNLKCQARSDWRGTLSRNAADLTFAADAAANSLVHLTKALTFWPASRAYLQT